jgi:hypothetical protein
MEKMTWLEALKIFNKGRCKYVIPKKGTPEYDKVKSIMMKGNSSRGQEKKDIKV